MFFAAGKLGVFDGPAHAPEPVYDSVMGATWSSTVRIARSEGGWPWLARSPLGQGLVLFTAVLLIAVLVPLVLLGVLLATIRLGTVALGRWVARLRGPNGALDGRRNVRVRVPETDE